MGDKVRRNRTDYYEAKVGRHETSLDNLKGKEDTTDRGIEGG